MKLNNNTVEQARNADIIAFFERYHGFTFANRGGVYRCKQHPSLAVKSDCRSWYWHSKGIGGFGALDYLVKVENMAFRDAVDVVASLCLSGGLPQPPIKPVEAPPPPPKVLKLPEKASMPLRLYEYLCSKRGIHSDIARSLVSEGKLYEDKQRNVVFVGYDEHNKPRFASLRGTQGDCSFRGDCSGSDKRYSFSVAAAMPSERLYIFESAIDLMSHASLENATKGDKNAWKQHNRLSLSGTADTALQHYLNTHKGIKELVFCLDNDLVGRAAAVDLARKYTDKGYTARCELPENKDFNADLLAYAKSAKRQKSHRLDHAL